MNEDSLYKRMKVLDYSLRLEALASFVLSYILEIDDFSKSKSFGNSSSALSFSQKVNLLWDCESISKSDKLKMESFMNVRNQFMHNLSCKTFYNAVSNIDGLEARLKKLYPENFKIKEDLEVSMENCVDSLFLNIKEILVSKKGLTQKKMELSARHEIFIKIIGKFNSSAIQLDKLWESIEKENFNYKDKSIIIAELKRIKNEIFVNSLKDI